MNILDFEFSNLDDTFKLHRQYEIVGPTEDELFRSFDPEGEIGSEAESEFGSTLDFGGMKGAGLATVGWCSSEVENDEQADKIINFIIEQIERRYGWKVKSHVQP